MTDTPQEKGTDTSTSENTQNASAPSLTPEELAKEKKKARKTFAAWAIFGVILMILGFFAGQNLKESRSGSIPTTHTVSIAVIDEDVQERDIPEGDMNVF